jgi:hypothetical protein
MMFYLPLYLSAFGKSSFLPRNDFGDESASNDWLVIRQLWQHESQIGEISKW